MIDLSPIALSIIYAYLVGSIPFAYLLARAKRGIDIRSYGSGNVGASNIAIHVGKGSFVLVASFDALVKGTASVALAMALGLGLEYQAAAGFLAVVGHNWSVYLRFSGGRGISVIAGCLILLAAKELVVSLIIVMVGWVIFRNTALWCGIALVFLPLWAVLFGEPVTIIAFCTAVLMASVLKRLLSNPGSGVPGLRWRDVAIARLLYDRDTRLRGDWVDRKPTNGDHQSGN